MSLPLPTFDQVLELPRSAEILVPADYVDHNGHMNVRRYLAIQDDAGFSYFKKFGFGEAHIEQKHRGFFDLEHHLRYQAEVLVDQTIAVHPRLLARSAKVVHVMSFMVNVTTKLLANTFEVTMAHVDLDARRTTPFDSEMAQTIDRQIEYDRRVSWPAPVCGVMGIR